MVPKKHGYCPEAESGIGDPWRALPTVGFALFVFVVVLLYAASGTFLIGRAALGWKKSILVKYWQWVRKGVAVGQYFWGVYYFCFSTVYPISMETYQVHWCIHSILVALVVVSPPNLWHKSKKYTQLQGCLFNLYSLLNLKRVWINHNDSFFHLLHLSWTCVIYLIVDHQCWWKRSSESNHILCSHPDAYPKSEMIYTWTKGPEKSVEVPKESSSLVQYDLIGQTVSSETIKSITGEMFNNLSQYAT